MSQLKNGAFLSYATIFLTNIVGLLLTPFIIKSLGDAEYGLYTLIGAFVGYIGILDFGLNNTIIRFIAKYKANNDKIGEENFLAICMLIYGIISFIIIIIGLFVYFNLDFIFSNSLNLEELLKAKIMFVILIINLAITLPGGAFSAICSGYEHFVFPRKLNIIKYIIRSLLVVFLLMNGGDSIELVLLDSLMNILVIIICGYYVFRKLNVKFKIHFLETSLIKEIFSFSSWIFIGVLIQQFQLQIGQVLIGLKLNTESVSVYSVGIMLAGYFSSFSGAISSVFLPRVTNLVFSSNGTEKIFVDQMIKVGRIICFILFFVFGGFLIFGKQFLILWLNEGYLNSWYVLIILMLSLILPLSQSLAGLFLQAKNKLRTKSLISLFFNFFGLILGYFLIEYIGLVGMALGTAIGISISFIALNIYYKYILNLNILLFFKDLIFNVFPLLSIIIILHWYIFNDILIMEWHQIIFYSFCYLLAYLLVLYFTVLNSYEKKLIYNIIKKND